ncbi:MAG: hypothetical protein HYV33_03210 [Candidatus Kerfeldbacteria bacterium]|nr:hypothetical protein [Candidatus Kerfeldbacteria bacterium]
MPKQNELPIDFMELAAVLMTLDYKLIRVDKTNQKHCIFYLEEHEDSYQLITRYFNSELTVDPKRLFINLRTLKYMIHSQY